MTAPTAFAETLSQMRDRQAQVRQQQQVASSSVDASRKNVNNATAKLEQSQTQLHNAQSALASIRVDLDNARVEYQRMVEALKAAQAALEQAKAEVAEGEANLAAQLKLMGQAARDAYQQHNPLEGLAIVFGSSSTAEMGQRIQWNTTIFDATSAQKKRLDEIQLELEAARDRMAQLEAQARADKEAAAHQVALIKDLERRATAQERAVAALVTANERLRNAAQQELAADEKAYRELESLDSQLTKEITAEVARIKAEEEKRAAAEAARRAAEEAAKRAAAEAAKKAAAAAQQKNQAASSGSSASSAPASPSRASTPSRSSSRTSSWGFIRPISANPGSRFGMRFHPILRYWRMHNGTDFGAPTGTPLYAAKAGKVMRAERAGGYGNFVLIGHGNINGKYVTTGYAHQSRIVVRRGQWVEQGQLIGYVGNTGLSTTPHLHLEVRLDGRPVNPMSYIP